MDSFLDNNRQKMKYAFKATSLIFLIIVLIVLILGSINNQLPDFWLFLTVILIAGLFFPVFIIGLAYLNWYNTTKIRKRIYGMNPFDGLENIGFTKSYLNKETKWFFTEEIKEREINDFRIICNAEPGIIEFTALTEPLKLDKNEYKNLKVRLKEYGLSLNFEGIAKQYRVKRLKIDSIDELKKDLEQFVNFLKHEKIKPR